MTKEALRALCRGLAVVSVVFGGIGMILCIPYLMSVYLTVITAASLPFIAGAILVSGGLVSYSVLFDK